MNYLTNPKLLNDTFNYISETVLVNDKPQKAIVTMAYLGERERRHISSLDVLKTGDYIEYKDATYIIAQEIETTRQNKYRSAIELCNITFEVETEGTKEYAGVDGLGRPIFIDVPGEKYDIPAFAENLTNKITNESWGTLQNTLVASVQSNEIMEETIELNTVIDIHDRNYAVTHIDRLVEGVLHLTLEFQRK